MVTGSSLTVRSETDDENVYTVAINGEEMLYSTVPINFDNSIVTTVTKHPHVVREWIEGVGNSSGHRHVGFEVEIDFFRDRIGTAQFCLGNRCLVFQLGDAQSCPPSLQQFLCANDKFTFVGTQVLYKMETLRRQLAFRAATPIGMKDLGFYDLGLFNRKVVILDSVAFPELLYNLNWARTYNLSHVQVHYACLDAFLNLHIANCLSIL